MKILIVVVASIYSVVSSELVIPSQFAPQLSVAKFYGDVSSRPFHDACDSEGTFVDMRIENCTDSTACNLITKREYNVQVDFIASGQSSNLVWKITAFINDELVTLVEETIEGEIQAGLGYTLNGYLAFGIASEGVSFLATYQIIDGPSERVESCSSSVLDVSSWHMVPEILSRTSAPIFPDRDFVITDFGAIDDGETDNTEAIRSAITACNTAGGGRVVVPAGVFASSAITLLSNVNLHLSQGSTILFTQDTSKYPNVYSRWEGMDLINFSPLIYAYEAENIALTGTGILNGNADCEHWWPWAAGDTNLQRVCGEVIGFPIQDEDRDNLNDMVLRNVPAEERIFGEGHYLRPNFVQLYRSNNILIEDVTLINSPMWILHPVLCVNVIVRGVTINSTGPNSQGCVPESCKDVLIENVTFRTGDDCISVKSGRNNDGRRVNVKSENVVVQNCEMEDGHGAFTFGSEISGGAQNIFCQNCQMNSPRLEQALRFKNNAVRGALIEDIFFRNIHIRELYTGTSASSGIALSIDFFYNEGPNGDYTPVVRNIDVRNVTASGANYPLFLRGLPNARISDVRLYDCHFDEVIGSNVIENIDNLGLFNVTVNGQIIDGTVPS